MFYLFYQCKICLCVNNVYVLTLLSEEATYGGKINVMKNISTSIAQTHS